MGRRQQHSRIVTLAARQSTGRWLAPLMIVSAALVLSVLVSGAAVAASHQSLQVSSLELTQPAQQVGYRANWVSRTTTRADRAYDKDEPVLARRLWAALAEQGDADSAYKLGMIYDMGNGVERDAARAVYWYRRAAEDGHPHAQHNLAVAYANGDGVDINISLALTWWKRAARLGNADSQYNLGIVYAMGVHGIERNMSLAKKWWRMAALKGDPMAQYNLGTIYANGDGQEVTSYCEAMRWWEKSAEKGVQQATWALEFIKTRQDFSACW